MQPANFEEGIDLILTKDTRFDREAYFFVREALDHTQKRVIKQGKDKIRHVSGKELLDGIRTYGLEQYGPMTLTVLSEWGVQRCADFGEIVFNMVENHLLAKTDRDSREDFKVGYEFEDAFQQPFIPTRRRRSMVPPSPSTPTPRP